MYDFRMTFLRFLYQYNMTFLCLRYDFFMSAFSSEKPCKNHAKVMTMC